jgi:hypothetical protein
MMGQGDHRHVIDSKKETAKGDMSSTRKKKLQKVTRHCKGCDTPFQRIFPLLISCVVVRHVQVRTIVALHLTFLNGMDMHRT